MDAQEMPALHVNTSVLQQEIPPDNAALGVGPLFTQPHWDPPENPEGPPDDPATHTMTTNPPPNRGGGLQGTTPTIFTSDQSHADMFLAEFHQYQLLNQNNDAMSNPFNHVFTALLYM